LQRGAHLSTNTVFFINGIISILNMGQRVVLLMRGELAHLAKRSSHIPFSCREYSRFSNTSVAILMELLDSPADPVCMAAGYSPGKTKPQCSEAGARWIYFNVRGISTSVIYL
jgi:hypothetical protein